MCVRVCVGMRVVGMEGRQGVSVKNEMRERKGKKEREKVGDGG